MRSLVKHKKYVLLNIAGLTIGLASFILIVLWFGNFAYKTTISWWIFALAGFAVTGIAILTVSLQSWHTAHKNLIEALRYE